MSSLFRLPSILTRPVGMVVETSVTLLSLPSRVVGLVAAAEQTLAKVNEAVALTQADLERTDGIIDRVDDVVATAQKAALSATTTIDQVDAITASAAPLLESYSEPLRRLEPTVRRMAETTHPQEIDALVSLIDRLPRLATAMDGDVIPLLGRIEEIGPDLNQLMDNVSDLNRMTSRIPKVFRRRRDDV
jgi:ABC-type transporter Mla subunit MlaD